ncbi:hypothetical protein GGQ85_002655 [Nitrobacter vulgaris]|uniref:hypothetical protein n=1 Tax=Nitrobacter vulgaris TaxID=29421 RepID=UPI00286219CA|nr:hypothetical protein [Nitrobacter vulgaris]MDR6304939.1 hypothetical protein [Nitrobacter vulgaris]
MRTSTFFSTVLALLLAGPPLAAAPAPSQSQTKSEEGVAIRSIQVVDVQELKGDVRSQVDDLVAHTKQEQMSSLRKTIEATPEAISALKAKGRNSAQVVAINIDKEGVLTLFTKAT